MNYMKKLLLIALLTIPCMAFAQEEDKPKLFPKLFGLNKSISVGLIGGGMETFDYGVMGLSTTIYGFYADFMGWPRNSYKDVKSTDWEELTVWSSHAGYQIPLHQYKDGSIRIIPMVGYYAKTEGAVFKVNDKTYTSTVTTGGFDYGAALVFQNRDNKIGYYNFSVGATKKTIWLGFGIDFRLKK